jgi:hypothetical protein
MRTRFRSSSRWRSRLSSVLLLLLVAVVRWRADDADDHAPSSATSSLLLFAAAASATETWGSNLIPRSGGLDSSSTCCSVTSGSGVTITSYGTVENIRVLCGTTGTGFVQTYTLVGTSSLILGGSFPFTCSSNGATLSLSVPPGQRWSVRPNDVPALCWSAGALVTYSVDPTNNHAVYQWCGAIQTTPGNSVLGTYSGQMFRQYSFELTTVSAEPFVYDTLPARIRGGTTHTVWVAAPSAPSTDTNITITCSGANVTGSPLLFPAGSMPPPQAFNITAPSIPQQQLGIQGSYYDNRNFNANDFVFSRLDANIDFDWTNSPADPRIDDPHDFSVRWTGTITPRYTETYTFCTRTDDGARLWVNSVQLVDKWTSQSVKSWCGTCPMVAGTPATIIVEYFDSGGFAEAELWWQSPSQTKEIVPAWAFGANTVNIECTFVVTAANGAQQYAPHPTLQVHAHRRASQLVLVAALGAHRGPEREPRCVRLVDLGHDGPSQRVHGSAGGLRGRSTELDRG